MLDALGSEGAMWTHEILKKIWDGENIPEDWRTRILVPVYKKKGDVLKCGNHRSIKLLEHLLKLQEKHLEGDKNLYHAFVDLEKAYNRVPRVLVYWCLRKKGVPEYLINIVKNTYECVTTMVRTPQGTSEEFEVKVGLHQGSSLSPLLFIIVIDVLVVWFVGLVLVLRFISGFYLTSIPRKVNVLSYRDNRQHLHNIFKTIRFKQ
ncbi:uncharacterized protein LOC134765749 [Penaeus indicus]|uniref:uncharacterized protein LOC134765749 n=1 Tax=Penaeus indicus TaxID=29960 RepID=UPI00300CCC3B